MIKAIIFDVFGVLYPNEFWEFLHAHEPNFDKKRGFYIDLTHRNDLGLLTVDQFWSAVSKEINMPKETILQELKKYSQVNLPLLDYVEELKSRGYKTGIISNVGPDFMKRMSPKLKTESNFDDVVLSHEVGLTKPDPAIYKLAAERLEVAPQDCVFIDDIDTNARGAEQAGMHGILYDGLPNLKKDLEKLLEDA